MKYEVVLLLTDLYKPDTRIEFENKVQKKLDEGWSLQGGICIVITNVNSKAQIYYSQAITREK